MTDKVILFAITDGQGHRAATWKCLSHQGKNDVYLLCEEIGWTLHASLHASGQWHIAFDRNFTGWSAAGLQDRELEDWPRPPEIAPGMTLAYRIVTPYSAVNTPMVGQGEASIHWIQNAPEGYATEIAVIFTRPNKKVTNHPGAANMNTQLVGSMVIANGETIWIVHYPMPMPEMANLQGQLHFFNGYSAKDLRKPSCRLLLLGDEQDGSRVILDCGFEIADKDPPDPQGEQSKDA